MNRPEKQPALETARLRLRAFGSGDAARIQEMAADVRVASMTSTIPHPYPDGAAAKWIAERAVGPGIVFAIERRDDRELLGVIGVIPEQNGLIAELGFWIGVPHWGRGYCTEAAREILRFCFEDLGLQRVHAGHFVGNEASGRVQEKIGLRLEGLCRWGASRFGELKDLVRRGMIRPDWEAGRAGGS